MTIIKFADVRVYISKEDFIRKLFPNLPENLLQYMEVTQNSGPDQSVEFEFRLYPEVAPEQMEKLGKEVERLFLQTNQAPNETKISDMKPELSVRVLNALHSFDIVTFRQLLAFKPINLRRRRGFGKVSLAEVEAFIKINSSREQ